MGNTLNIFGLGNDTTHSQRDAVENPMITITNIVVNDVLVDPLLLLAAISKQRIPVGIYISITINECEYQTTNKPIKLGRIEWDDKITLQINLASKVSIKVYTSFEEGPMLGQGELLHTFQVTVKELQRRSERSKAFSFPKNENIPFLHFSSLQLKMEHDRLTTAPPFPSHTEAGSFQKVAQETDKGHAALLLFRKNQQERDLSDAINHFEIALGLCSSEHPYRFTVIFNLAAAKYISLHEGNKQTDLDDIIILYREALSLRAVGDLDRTNILLHLGVALFSRAQERHLQDAKEAEMIIRDVLRLCQSDDLYFQTTMLLYTCDTTQVQEVEDLGSVVEDPSNSSLFQSLDALRRALEQCRNGNLRNVQIGLLGSRLTLIQCSPGSPLRPGILTRLGMEFSLAFDRDNDEKLIDIAISLLRDSLSLEPDQADTLNNLAATFSKRFTLLGAKQDLDDTILHLQKASLLQPSVQPITINLIGALELRYALYNNQQDLDDVVMHSSKTTASPSMGNPSFVLLYAVKLVNRFERRHDRNDLETAIAITESVLEGASAGSPRHISALHCLAFAFWLRFELTGKRQDLDGALSYSQQALKESPVDHQDRTCTLYVIAEAYRARFEYTTDVQDLSEAIIFYREHLSLRPNVLCLLTGLANALMVRCEHQGNKEDLDDTILQIRKHLESSPIDDQNNLSVVMCILGRALFRRFEIWDNDSKNLDESIQCLERALALTSVDHTNYPTTMNTLGGALIARFELDKDTRTAKRVIQVLKESLTLLADEDPRRFHALNALGVILKKLDDSTSLAESILFLTEALGLTANVVSLASFRPDVLYNIAGAYLMRYHQQHNKQDLYDADQHVRNALTLYDASHMNYTDALVLLAHITCLDPQDCQPNKPSASKAHYLDTAMNFFKDATESHSAPYQRLNASIKWARCAEVYGHDSALEAYKHSLQLSDAHLSATISLSSRHEMMKIFPPFLVVNAVSRAVRVGEICQAVELLEQGRTLLWTQMGRFRARIDQLLKRDDHSKELATKFMNISSLLNDSQSTDRSALSAGSAKSAEENARHYERVFHDWNAVVEQIRNLDGFSRFLLPPLFSDVQEAACEGPVIILIASTYSCDAIIVYHKQSPSHVQLPTEGTRLAKLAESLQATVHRTRDDSNTEHKLREILQDLWDLVVSPVVAELEKSVKKRSRIWWCPTSVLALLPIHAAGEYFRPHGKHLSQLYVSSYTPSLSALIKARSFQQMSSIKKVAAIGQNQPADHHLPLESVEKELDLLENTLPHGAVEFSKITSAESTRDLTLHTLLANEWVHFSCHGEQRVDKPYESRFLMRDGPLTLFEISRSDLTALEFAFLSACETAVGDMSTLDEVIHLAAALQFAGVKSVIGTMWEVEDATVCHLVESFYKNMFADGKADCKKAAQALHKALRSPAVKKMTLAQRIVFVHIGI